jgi:oligopeptide/dipeptide ABC transporter ATP-binding protein
MEALLRVDGLCVSFGAEGQRSLATRDVGFELSSGERLGIVGESGSGKSTTALAIVGLLPRTAMVEQGSVVYNGQELVGLAERQLRAYRGREIAMVFQNASTALNPLIRVGDQIADVVESQQRMPKRRAHEHAVELLTEMGIVDASRNARSYPHEYSGGMAQRALIAMALACRPRVLLADEPTTGLDPIVQAQVLDKIVERVVEQQMSLIVISHDIDVIWRTCTHAVVLYAGQVMEAGPCQQVLRHPQHPYTRALLDAEEPGEDGRFSFIPGRVPSLTREFSGCAFYDRCQLRASLGDPVICVTNRPPETAHGGGSRVACHFVSDADS